MRRFALLAAVLVGCGERASRADTSSSGLDTGSLRVVSPAPATSPAPGQCPETGRWAECNVFQRLDRAGLAPLRDSSAARQPGISVSGTRYRIGSGELDVYIYADDRARERDESRLDRDAFVSFNAPMPMQPLPTLIPSRNLLAILRSRNDHQRERVADALTAGPPIASPSPKKP